MGSWSPTGVSREIAKSSSTRIRMVPAFGNHPVTWHEIHGSEYAHWLNVLSQRLRDHNGPGLEFSQALLVYPRPFRKQDKRNPWIGIPVFPDQALQCRFPGHPVNDQNARASKATAGKKGIFVNSILAPKVMCLLFGVTETRASPSRWLLWFATINGALVSASRALLSSSISTLMLNASRSTLINRRATRQYQPRNPFLREQNTGARATNKKASGP